MESNPFVPDRIRELAHQLILHLQHAQNAETVPSLSPSEIQQLFTLLTKEYVASRRLLADDPEFAEMTPFTVDGNITATDVAITANDMLRSVDMDSFELNMWRALGSL